MGAVAFLRFPHYLVGMTFNVYGIIKLCTKDRRCAMRTNIVIDDQLITDVQKITGIKTKKGVVEEGLKLLLRLKRQEMVKNRRGKLKWTGNLETMRLDKKV